MRTKTRTPILTRTESIALSGLAPCMGYDAAEARNGSELALYFLIFWVVFGVIFLSLVAARHIRARRA